MCLNRTSEWKVMIVWISWELLLFNFERLDILWASIIHPSQNLLPFEFVERFLVQIWVPRYIIGLNRTSKSKVMAAWICLALPCIISSVSIYYAPESDIRVKSYDHLNMSTPSFVQFRVSQYIIGLNHEPESKDMAICICQSFRVQFWASRYVTGLNRTSESKVTTIWIFLALPCLISYVSIYYAVESDIREKSYKHLIFLRTIDVSSIGACRPRIFFINGFLCFLEDEWQRNGEGRERGDTTSRRRWV